MRLLLSSIAMLVGLMAWKWREVVDYNKEIPESSYRDQKCELIGKDKMAGSEDLTIWRDGILLVTSGDVYNWFHTGPLSCRPGAIFAFNVEDKSLEKLEIKEFPQGDKPSGFQPHGMFFSNTTNRLYVVSHAAVDGVPVDKIEVFDVVDTPSLHLKYVRSIESPLLQPGMANDVIEGAEDGSDVYITQFFPFAKTLGSKRVGELPALDQLQHALHLPLCFFGLKRTRLFHCKFDPSQPSSPASCRFVDEAGPFGSANGITIDSKRQTVFVNDLPSQEIVVLRRKKDGTLERMSSFLVKHTVDNIEYDAASGALHMGTIPFKYLAMQTASVEKWGDLAIPGGLLTVTLLGTGDGSFVDGVQKDVVIHHGNLLSQISSAIKWGDIAVLGSPFSDGILVCPTK